MKLALSETPKTGFLATRPNYYGVLTHEISILSHMRGAMRFVIVVFPDHTHYFLNATADVFSEALHQYLCVCEKQIDGGCWNPRLSEVCRVENNLSEMIIT